MAADVLERLGKVVVMIPVGVPQLDVAHATLHQTARQQAVGGKARLAGFDAVEGQRLFALFGKVDQFGPGRLHAIGHLIGGNARVDFGVGHRLMPHGIDVANGVDHLILHAWGDAFGRR